MNLKSETMRMHSCLVLNHSLWDFWIWTLDFADRPIGLQTHLTARISAVSFRITLRFRSPIMFLNRMILEAHSRR